jgi:hypothetical protein
MATEAPVYNGSAYNFATRTITYAQGDVASSLLVQTGVGTSFINSQPINAIFQRTNIALQDANGATIPYSSKVYVHRLLPEISGSGNLNISVGGAASVAQSPVFASSQAYAVVNDHPWINAPQNNFRTLSFNINSNDTTSSWNITALNWQATVTEDAF